MNQMLLGFLKKEFIQSLRDKRMRILLFGAPVIQMTLFGVALSNEVKNIQLQSRVEPKDYLAVQIYERSLSSKWFIPAKKVQADATLYGPSGGTTRATQKGAGEIQVVIDATNVVKAQSINLYLRTIVDRVLRDFQGIKEQITPLRFDIRVLYNPTMKSAVYMVPGVMSLVLCVVTIILTSMALAREKEIGTFEMLISSPLNAWQILAGKTIPYVVLGMINIPLTFTAAVTIFDVPMRGPLLLFFLASFAFVCTTVAIGILVSTFSANQQQAMLGGFIFLFPAILLSGIMYPLENMPKIMTLVAALNPLKYFVSLLRNIMLKGGNLEFVLFNTTILFLMATIAWFISFKRFRHTLQ